MRKRTAVLVVCATTLAPAAAADEAKTMAGVELDDERPRVDVGAAIGATASVNDNRNVIGQTDGSTITFGYKVDFGLAWLNGKHEWRDAVFIAQSLTKTPAIAPVLKSQDALRFETIYLFHALPWVGPFVRLAGDGPVLAGFDDRAAPTAYVVRHVDGTNEALTATHLRLTDMFRPYNLSESAGPFFRPVRSEPVNVELRVGGAARQTFAAHQLAIADDKATPEVEVDELQSFYQAGAEAALAIWGKPAEDRVIYKTGVEVMMPFYRSDTLTAQDKSVLALTNVIAYATASFKLVSWATVDYDLRVVRQPQLIDKVQVQNHLFLTFGVNVGTAPPVKK
jgi:hypothetical protein